MNTTGTTTQEAGAAARAWAFSRVAGGSTMEAFAAVSVIVLSIIGLAGIIAPALAAISTIIIGGAFLWEGGAVSSGYRQTVTEAGGAQQSIEFEGGMTAEFMAGVAGIVLGILGLFGIDPPVLLAAAVIAFGGAILLTGTAMSRLSWFLGTPADAAQARIHEMVHDAAAHAGAKTFAGLGAVVLGILAVIGLAPMVLILVALIALGVAALAAATAVRSRVARA